jgi:hypothetical protein
MYVVAAAQGASQGFGAFPNNWPAFWEGGKAFL